MPSPTPTTFPYCLLILSTVELEGCWTVSQKSLIKCGFNFWLLPWELSSLESFYILTRSPPKLLLKSFGWWNPKFQDSWTQNFCIITLDSYCIFSSGSLWNFRFLKKKISFNENYSFLGMFIFLCVCTYKAELSADLNAIISCMKMCEANSEVLF